MSAGSRRGTTYFYYPPAAPWCGARSSSCGAFSGGEHWLASLAGEGARAGCQAGRVATLIEMTSDLPLVACSLDSSGQQTRLAEWADLLARARTREETASGMRYTFAAEDELKTRVGALAAAEHSCCSFLEFEIAETGAELELTVTAPANGQEALRFIFA